LRRIKGYAKQTVSISEHQVTRVDDHAADCNRHIDFTRPVFVRPPMGNPGSIDRKGACLDGIEVANGTVEHDAAQASLDRRGHHQLAHQCVGKVAPTVNHNHVTGLCQMQSLVDHQVVTRACFHGKRRPNHPPGFVIRAQMGAASDHAAHAVADVGNRHRAEAFDQCCGQLACTREDSKSDHYYFPS